MEIWVLFLISSLITLCGRIFSKLSSNIIAGSSSSSYTVYFAINGAVACIFFLFSGGFKLSFNMATWMYSIAFATVVAISLLANTNVYKFASISNVNIIVTSAGLVGSAVIGSLVFSETLQAEQIIRIAIMLISALLIYFENKRKSDPEIDNKKRSGVLQIAVISAVVFVALANSLIIKSFSISEAVTDTNSFFFLTNLILVIGAVIVIAFEWLRHPAEVKESIALLKPKTLASLAGNTVFSNFSSLLSVVIMASLPLSVYSPISSALGVLVSLSASLIFREKLGILSYLASALAVLAVII